MVMWVVACVAQFMKIDSVKEEMNIITVLLF